MSLLKSCSGFNPQLSQQALKKGILKDIKWQFSEAAEVWRDE
jgi:hypothetical protein